MEKMGFSGKRDADGQTLKIQTRPKKTRLQDGFRGWQCPDFKAGVVAQTRHRGPHLHTSCTRAWGGGFSTSLSRHRQDVFNCPRAALPQTLPSFPTNKPTSCKKRKPSRKLQESSHRCSRSQGCQFCARGAFEKTKPKNASSKQLTGSHPS